MTGLSLPELVRSGEYRRSWIRPDVLAGLTVAAMLVPQAMAYAELGGLPPSAGFRAALVALPIYALLGTSRHLGVGPEPGTAILAAAAAVQLADGDPARYAALMATIAGLVGVIALLAGVFRFGFVAELLSKPVLVGYITGVGLTLLTSQLRSFTGVGIDADNPFVRVGQFVTRLDQVDGPTLAVGVSTLLVILVLRRHRPSWPGALIGLAGAMLAVAAADIDVAVVGDIDAASAEPRRARRGVGRCHVAAAGRSGRRPDRVHRQHPHGPVDIGRSGLRGRRQSRAAGLRSDESRRFDVRRLSDVIERVAVVRPGDHRQQIAGLQHRDVRRRRGVSARRQVDPGRDSAGRPRRCHRRGRVRRDRPRRVPPNRRAQPKRGGARGGDVPGGDRCGSSHRRARGGGSCRSCSPSAGWPGPTTPSSARVQGSTDGSKSTTTGHGSSPVSSCTASTGLCSSPTASISSSGSGRRSRPTPARRPASFSTWRASDQSTPRRSTTSRISSWNCEDDGIVVSLARANTKVLDLLTRAGIVSRLGSDRVFPTINAAVQDHRRRDPGQADSDSRPSEERNS